MKLDEVKQKLTPILKEYNISKASVFGSVARDEARPDSDVDLMIELGSPMGMIKYVRMIESMEEKLGRNVDLVTNRSLNEHLRPYVLKELRLIYENR